MRKPRQELKLVIKAGQLTAIYDDALQSLIGSAASVETSVVRMRENFILRLYETAP